MIKLLSLGKKKRVSFKLYFRCDDFLNDSDSPFLVYYQECFANFKKKGEEGGGKLPNFSGNKISSNVLEENFKFRI